MEDKENSGSEWPRQEDARDYLQKHQIVELFDNMTSKMIYDRPVDPREFMIDYLENLQKSKTTKMDYPCLFDETNIESIYGMLDPTGRGHITLQQYREAMTTLGLEDFDLHPHGSDRDAITLETFTKEAKKGLMRKSATYYDLARV